MPLDKDPSEMNAPKPQPKPSGSIPPPRPPRRTAVALGPGDEPHKITPKKETVRINLPPKPSQLPPGKPPTTPPQP
jgi:hypothetical protein